MRFSKSAAVRLLQFGLLALLLLAARNHFSLAQFRSVLSHVRWTYLLIIVLLLSPAALVLRCLRWRLLASSAATPPLWRFIAAYLAGVLANSILVGNLGDLVKAKAVLPETVSYGESVGTVLVDRLVEQVTLAGLFCAVVLTSPAPPWAHRAAILAAAVVVAVAGTMLLLLSHRELLHGWRAHSRSRIRQRGVAFLIQIVDGWASLRSSRRMAAAFAYSLAVWTVEVLIQIVLMEAFALQVPRVAASLMVISVLSFAGFIPLTPGSVGVYQLLCALALSVWGVAQQVGISYGIVLQTVLYIPLYLGGIVVVLTLRPRRGPLRETHSADAQ